MVSLSYDTWHPCSISPQVKCHSRGWLRTTSSEKYGKRRTLPKRLSQEWGHTANVSRTGSPAFVFQSLLRSSCGPSTLCSLPCALQSTCLRFSPWEESTFGCMCNTSFRQSHANPPREVPNSIKASGTGHMLSSLLHTWTPISNDPRILICKT